ncbi:GTP cyclohydrolase I [Haloactinopolyspora alba]|uniref:GTP cyclohydrolase 1 n=1 Tax=Haloactinopolyspora alba TaxID=648780 RepID=A0A2P8DEY2_9ACTN|nr:GTP cyclohydrolase I [Haloactinopolyspora alba]PSK95786.1 GTP cyclohydrolase I [Haloactinopolyspora alba]
MTTTANSPAVDAAALMLGQLGLYDPDSDASRDTPRRLVQALTEMTAGQHVDPDRHLKTTFPPESDDPGLIVVTAVPFISVCEHHLLPFTGTATVGYLPSAGARIVGLSKLSRVVQEYAARPQVQERLGQQVVDALTRHLDTRAAGCVIRSAHSCMTHRGARATGAEMVTSHLAGQLRTDPAMRSEFMALTR